MNVVMAILVMFALCVMLTLGLCILRVILKMVGHQTEAASGDNRTGCACLGVGELHNSSFLMGPIEEPFTGANWFGVSAGGGRILFGGSHDC